MRLLHRQALRHIVRLISAKAEQGPSAILWSHLRFHTTPKTIMASKKTDLKRKADSAETSNGKQQKVDRVEGWLENAVAELRKDNKDLKFNMKRLRYLSENEKVKPGSDGVVYWMGRDQRVQDNWALIYAQQLAIAESLPLHICFSLMPKFLEATFRHYSFMIKGLQEVAKECKVLDIQFHLLSGFPGETLPGFIKEWNMGAVVTDFWPLRDPTQWVDDVKKAISPDIPLIQVDAHNVVPCWEASGKLEYSARTIRGKITKLLPTYLTEFPIVDKHPHTSKRAAESVNWDETLSSLDVDRSVGEVDWAKPGYSGGMAILESFINERLRDFASLRNNPNVPALSQLSPWIHSGSLSAQRVVRTVQKNGKKFSESVASFTEELVVRRELADNFCFYNENYDKVEGAYEWAQKTLKVHAKDKRSHVYTREQWAQAKTHDKLWNAAQTQLLTEGKMHGFMRMYWAKKILEWTSSPEEALSIAIYLNDRYSLDGCDPNGYVGCMWSICGIHDQGWAERAVFGKIRYMNYDGCKRKFDVAEFERKYTKKT
ncbi:CPD photolyase [Engraulis encrasicolus]|uniref:CPD photolyase n=1 Tax=Engraulis encrasicolus TaxID=184585 RepID=UPI002FD49748